MSAADITLKPKAAVDRHPKIAARLRDALADVKPDGSLKPSMRRFYFQIEGRTYVLLDILKHPR